VVTVTAFHPGNRQHAIIATHGQQPTTRTVTILVNPLRFFLPVILKDG